MAPIYHPPGTWQRPYETGITRFDWRDTCYLCTWIWHANGTARLKFWHAGCKEHASPDIPREPFAREPSAQIWDEALKRAASRRKTAAA